jgi:SAM-dependent methyltransferase
MLPQPQPSSYRDGFNPSLCDAVPVSARRVLDVGCAAGRLGAELKQRVEGRYVAGIEIDAEAARVAATRLDDVFVVDVEESLPPIEPGSLDCIVFGDVLEHLRNPEIALRRLGQLLTADGSVIVSVPNVQHASVLKAIVRGDFMYQPEGLLDGTHLRFFTAMSFTKLMCDAGFLPRITYRVPSGAGHEFVERATPLLQLHGVSPDTAVESFDTFQYIFTGTRLQLPDAPFADTPISFVVCSNDPDQLESNLRRSPCLDPGTPHELIVLRDQASAADGYQAGREQATNDIVVFVHQDVYLPRGWDSQLIDQFTSAEHEYGPIGVAGAFGYTIDGDVSTHVGRIVDRQTLLAQPTPLPALVNGLDEVVLVMRRESPLRFDPRLGFHLYGADLSLQAREQRLAVVVLDVPCVHNSLFAHLPPAFAESRDRLLEKWPNVRPVFGSMGRLDDVLVAPLPVTWFDERNDLVERLALATDRADVLHTKLGTTQAELDDRQRHIQNIESSVFWKTRNGINRLLRRN